jgi:hypothetical protein
MSYQSGGARAYAWDLLEKNGVNEAIRLCEENPFNQEARRSACAMGMSGIKAAFACLDKDYKDRVFDDEGTIEDYRRNIKILDAATNFLSNVACCEPAGWYSMSMRVPQKADEPAAGGK